MLILFGRQERSVFPEPRKIEVQFEEGDNQSSSGNEVGGAIDVSYLLYEDPTFVYLTSETSYR